MTDYKPGGEVRVTSATGGEKGQKDARLGGCDPLALMELARVYGFGERKYARYNYLKGYDWSLSIDALLRHLMAFLSGEDRDPETGLLHTAHLAWHGLALTSFQLRKVGTDDRAPSLIDYAATVETLPNRQAQFLCGHRFGDAPTVGREPGEPNCGTAVHWSATEGILFNPHV